jgi:hypothetical protein
VRLAAPQAFYSQGLPVDHCSAQFHSPEWNLKSR